MAELSRRHFLIGCATAVAAPLAVQILPVETDPLIRRIVYQSWPFDQPRPFVDYSTGSLTLVKPCRLSQLSQVVRPHMTYFRVEV